MVEDEVVPVKKITVKKIAELAEVSIGTVDRALNDRGGINPETKRKILEIAQKYHYRPNRLSQALAGRSRKTITLGVITLPSQNPFAKKMNAAIEETANQLSDYGLIVAIYPLKRFDANEHAKKINEYIANNVNGLAMVGIDAPAVVKAVNSAAERGVPVVTFNSDLPGSKRLCFVGQDLYQSGMIAADLLGRFLKSKGNVAVLHGSDIVPAHQERLTGFQAVIKKEFPAVTIVAVEQCHDNETIAYKNTLKLLRGKAGIDGLYVIARASHGTAKAIYEMEQAESVRVVCNDIDSTVKGYIRKNVIDATILQDPCSQGSLPIKILFDLLFDGKKPEKELFYTKTEILTKHMV